MANRLFPGKGRGDKALILTYLDSAMANRLFPGKGRGDKALILTYLDSAMAKVSLRYCLFFSISAIFRGKRGSDRKC